MGITDPVSLNKKQKETISQWIGCSNFIWNAKTAEEKYQMTFAKKYLPIRSFPKVDQRFSQYKNSILSPWLSDCPSQILRNSSAKWYRTYQNYLKGICNKPKRKKKSQGGSILLTKELFNIQKISKNIYKIFIGTKTNNIGFVKVKIHKKFKDPASIVLKKRNGKYSISFCSDDGLDESKLLTEKQHLNYLSKLSKEILESQTIGIDRGVKIPVQTTDKMYDFTKEQKRKKKAREKYIKRMQKALSRKNQGSKRWKKQKHKIAKAHEKISNIRKDFCHKTSHAIVNNKNTKVIIFEDLKTSQMTKKPKAKKDEKTQKWLKNNRKSKAGLNKAILDKGWHLIELFVKYKAYRALKAVFKIPANYTSQECADCGHTHSNNRKTQDQFICENCNNSDNADNNAAKVIKKRAINLILDSGTELSKRGVLLDSGCGAANKTRKANVFHAHGCDTSKKIVKAFVA